MFVFGFSFPRFKQSHFFQSFLTSVEEWNLTTEQDTEKRPLEEKLLAERRNSAFGGISPKQSVRQSAFTSKGQFLPSSLARTMSGGGQETTSVLAASGGSSDDAFKGLDDRNRAKTTM